MGDARLVVSLSIIPAGSSPPATMEVRADLPIAMKDHDAQDLDNLLEQVLRCVRRYMRNKTHSYNVEILTPFIACMLRLVHALPAPSSSLIQLQVELSS